MNLLDQEWQLEFHSGIPVYMQIIHRVQAAVAEGLLKEGDQLPTIRALHQKLGVNPNTVVRAYRELEHLGVLSAEHGSGCFVSPQSAVRPPALPAREKKAKLQEICARVAAEARSHGITLNEVVQQLRNQNPA